MPDTDIIREARELCERATPGAWEWKMSKEYYGEIEATYMVSPSEVVIELENDYPGYPECGEHLIMQLTKADADFIARSRTLIPELLDLLAAKDAEIARLKDALRKAGNNCDFCKHKLSGECEAADFDCERCTRDCKCKTCRDNSNWEFL